MIASTSLLDTFACRATLVFSRTLSRGRLSRQRYPLYKSSIRPDLVDHRPAPAARTTQSDSSCSCHAHHGSCPCHTACTAVLWAEAGPSLLNLGGACRNPPLCLRPYRPSCIELDAFHLCNRSMTSRGHPRRRVASSGSCSHRQSLWGYSILSCMGHRSTQLSPH